jgi:hypothetical protein
MFNAVVAVPAEGNEVGVFIRPAIPDCHHMMHIELDTVHDIQFVACSATVDASEPIAGLDPGPALTADAGGVIGSPAPVVWVLGPHRAGDLGAPSVEATPPSFAGAGAYLHQPAT